MVSIEYEVMVDVFVFFLSFRILHYKFCGAIDYDLTNYEIVSHLCCIKY